MKHIWVICDNYHGIYSSFESDWVCKEPLYIIPPFIIQHGENPEHVFNAYPRILFEEDINKFLMRIHGV